MNIAPQGHTVGRVVNMRVAVVRVQVHLLHVEPR